MVRMSYQSASFRSYCDNVFLKRLRLRLPDIRFQTYESKGGVYILFCDKMVGGMMREMAVDLWEQFHFRREGEDFPACLHHLFDRIRITFDKAGK